MQIYQALISGSACVKQVDAEIHGITIGRGGQSYIYCGSANTVVGASALKLNNGGVCNTTIGEWSQSGSVSGSGNTSIGAYSLQFNQSGNCNIALGVNSGFLANCNFDNTITIGYGTIAETDNQIIVGNTESIQAKFNNYRFNIDQSVSDKNGWSLQYNSNTDEIELNNVYSGSFCGDGSGLSNVPGYGDGDVLDYINSLQVVSGSLIDLNWYPTSLEFDFTGGFLSLSGVGMGTLTASFSGNLVTSESFNELTQSFNDFTQSFGDFTQSYYFDSASFLTIISESNLVISASTSIDVSNTENVYYISHADTSTLSAGGYGSVGIASIGIDDLGHVTNIQGGTFNYYTDSDVLDYINSLQVVSGSIVDNNWYPTSLEFDFTGGVLSLSGVGMGTLTASFSGNLVTSESFNDLTQSFNDLTQSFNNFTESYYTTIITSSYCGWNLHSNSNLVGLVSSDDNVYICAGSGISLGYNSNPKSITINHSDFSGLNGSYGGNGIAEITVDQFGHVTNIQTATYNTSSVTDTNDYVDSISFTNGNLVLGRTGVLSDLTVCLDGRYCTTDTDTNDYVDSISFTNGNLVLGRTGVLSDLTVCLDGRYCTTDTDTNNYVDSVSFIGSTLTLGRTGGLSDLTTTINTGTTYTGGTGVTISGSLISIGQDVSTVSGVQFRSLGVGTAASATIGEIRAIDNIVSYYSSDCRLKTNIKSIEDPLNKIEKINGVTFDWNDTYINQRGGVDGYFVKKHDIGIIAQEVESILPEIVADRQDGYKAVRYELLVPLLIESIKELKREIDILKSK